MDSPRWFPVPSWFPGKIGGPEALDRLISLYQSTENAEAEQKWSQEKERYKPTPAINEWQIPDTTKSL